MTRKYRPPQHVGQQQQQRHDRVGADGSMRVFWNDTNDQLPASRTATRVWIESRCGVGIDLLRRIVAPTA
ncbi:MAG: hypothetical protein ACRDSH_22775 [Pseudonocardiaceae bacterium]